MRIGLGVLAILVGCTGGKGDSNKDSTLDSSTTQDTASTAVCPTGTALLANFEGSCELPTGQVANVAVQLDIDPEACTAGGYLTIGFTESGVYSGSGWGLEADFGPLPLILAHDPDEVRVVVPEDAATHNTVTFPIKYTRIDGGNQYFFGSAESGSFDCNLDSY